MASAIAKLDAEYQARCAAAGMPWRELHPYDPALRDRHVGKHPMSDGIEPCARTRENGFRSWKKVRALVTTGWTPRRRHGYSPGEFILTEELRKFRRGNAHRYQGDDAVRYRGRLLSVFFGDPK